MNFQQRASRPAANPARNGPSTLRFPPIHGPGWVLPFVSKRRVPTRCPTSGSARSSLAASGMFHGMGSRAGDGCEIPPPRASASRSAYPVPRKTLAEIYVPFADQTDAQRTGSCGEIGDVRRWNEHLACEIAHRRGLEACDTTRSPTRASCTLCRVFGRHPGFAISMKCLAAEACRTMTVDRRRPFRTSPTCRGRPRRIPPDHEFAARIPSR